MYVMGIDPGQKGGIGVLRDGLIVHACALPVRAKEVQVSELAALIELYEPLEAVVERQVILSRQAGALALGANYGRLLGTLELLGVPHRTISPAVWNQRAGIPRGLKGKAKKEQSFVIARRTWGKAFDALRLRASQDGVVEALLIARFG